MPGIGPKLETSLVVPSQVRAGSPITAWIEYRNTGDTPMAAPLFVLSANGGAYLSLDESIRSGSVPANATDKAYVWVFGSTATPGTLQPGESGQVPVYGVARSGISWTLGSVTATSTDSIDWASMKNDAKPEWYSATAWDAAWSAFTAQIGNTWGAFVKKHAEIVNYMQDTGQDASQLTLGQTLAFAVVQASQSGPSSILASATDAYSPAPGIALTFSRVFAQSPQSRFDLGALGYGWSSNWDFQAQTLSTGDVVIRSPGGSDRFFTKNASTGAFSPFREGALRTDPTRGEQHDSGRGTQERRRRSELPLTPHSAPKTPYCGWPEIPRMRFRRRLRPEVRRWKLWGALAVAATRHSM